MSGADNVWAPVAGLVCSVVLVWKFITGVWVGLGSGLGSGGFGGFRWVFLGSKRQKLAEYKEFLGSFREKYIWHRRDFGDFGCGRGKLGFVVGWAEVWRVRFMRVYIEWLGVGE